MRIVDRNALVPYSPAEMYALVDDVAAYPEFLPWCAASELMSREPHELTAAITVGYGAFNSQFTTCNELQPPETMIMRLRDGPFSSLEGRWHFRPIGERGCEVHLRVEFEFASKMQDMLVGSVFESICNELIDAFIQRAHEQYG